MIGVKLSLEADVKSQMLLSETVTVRREDAEYIFHRGEDGTFSKISIISPVPDPSKFYTKLDPRRGGGMVLGTDWNLVERLRGELQDFEGLFALAFNLSSIGWDTAHRQTLTDDGEQIEGYQKTMRIPGGGPIEVPCEAFERFVGLRGYCTEFRVPLSFWREGNNELRSLRFINAFFNFYFILEGLYANGKTATVEVKKQFQKSVELNGFIAAALPDHLNVGQLPNPLMQLLTDVREEATVDGVIAMLVTVRGQLHHYSHKSTRRQGSPLSHKHYDAAAFLCGRLATDALRTRLSTIVRESA
jgi:hypothetical protein